MDNNQLPPKRNDTQTAPGSELEREIMEALEEGEMEETDAGERARKILPHMHEIRIQAQLDPIVEETMQYRKLAKEVDDRYDNYLKRAEGRNEGNPKEPASD